MKQNRQTMKLHEALREGEGILKESGIADASVDAFYLLEYVTGLSRALFLANRKELIDETGLNCYRELIQRRASHIPLQHLTGEQEFMGFPFYVNEHVLVPRQDTEILVEETLRRLKPGMRVLDLCTGSGCIAVSLEKLCPGILAEGADISGAALEVAAKNARRLGASVRWVESDLFEKLTGPYDLIVSNPPYIRTAVIEELSEEVRLHEPRTALDGREDGLFFYRKIIKESAEYLKEGGWLLFEIGYDQGEDVLRLLSEAGYETVPIVQDLAGLDRVAAARRRCR